MPIEGDAPNPIEYKMPIGGVNINDGRLGVTETQALTLKNLFVRGGIKKRNGYSKRSEKEVNPGTNSINLLHRFYKQDNTSVLFASAGELLTYETTDIQKNIHVFLGTVIHDATSQSANAFDGVTVQAAASCATKTGATQFLIGKDWGALNERTISGFLIHGSSDQGFVNGANPNITVTLEGSTDNFVASTVSLGVIAATPDSNGLIMSMISGITTTTAYRYHRLKVDQDGGAATMYVAEVEFLHETPWADIVESLNPDAIMHAETWGAVDKVYFANGVDSGFSVDGSFNVDTTILAGIVPIQFLEYQDRLLVISVTEPGTLRWSDSFSDTNFVSAASTGIRPDSYLHGMVIHSAADNQEQGQNAQVLLAGSSGMYLFSGTNLSLTFSNYTLQSLATKVGCIAPDTMQWTPMGTMWLGTDLQVYLLPFDSLVPIPVGEPVRSKIFSMTGIENITAANMPLCSAVYQDGFYKLSIPSLSTSTFNDEQWWMDVFASFTRSNSQSVVNRALSVGWFGPMTNMSFSAMEALIGSGDTGTLVAGEGDSSVGSFVYNITPTDVSDDGISIPYQWRSFYNPLSSPFVNSICHHLEVEMLNTQQIANINFEDSAGGASSAKSIIDIVDTGAVYNEIYYGENFYGGLEQSRITVGITPPVNQRYVSINMTGDTSQKMELYAFRLREEQQSASLGVRRT